MSKSVEFFFDVASPYTYLAATQIDGLCERCGATAQWRPFLLGGVFKATGNTMPARVVAKAQYMPKDLSDWARHYGVAFAFPAHFPINSVGPMRACLAAEEQGRLKELARALFDAYWTQGKKIDDPAVMKELARGVGLDAEKLAARIAEADLKEKLKATTADAVAKGAFGAPTFYYGGRIYWGNDRLEILAEALQAS